MPKYPRMGASSRLRTFQFLPLWEKAGFGLKIAPFFNEKYLKEKYVGKGVDKFNVLACYLYRLWVLLGFWRYDVVWVEKELFPFVPAWAEWVLSALGKGYVVDYDDAVFHRYDMARRSLVRKFLGNKIDKVMRYSNIVWAGNSYLAARAKAAGAKKIVLLPTVIDPSRYGKKQYEEKERVVIGWIGSPTTIKYLKTIRPVLEKLCKEQHASLMVVGGSGGFGFEGSLDRVQWTEQGEVDAIHRMDIGIMPLPDDPWEKGKCAYKLIQYMACGLPVVASPVGMNLDVVLEGENGFFAKDEAAWEEALRALILDAVLRKKQGEKGYELIMEKYTLEMNFEVMVGELRMLN
ncbi:glycosyltransferase family 4 protein [Aquiflexum gelatinilyticum]|uniref:glycosyltransferase family 4 protein n=1 Tax=Aquiflexum gelatinilyticum TaxID=2961943 RepID=UPI00216885B6|nr:glycosyltransferase family 4 protein [Aquiflexum gelatinilyticum]MCS4434571.1 glycosyltransferase family 4 protein [Aquiflexum gelatinilyticum]